MNSPRSHLTMSSPNPAPTHDSSLQADPTHVSNTPNEPLNPHLAETTDPNEAEGEEEEAECGFCLFMKAGGCRDTFIDWEKCVDEGEKNKEDIVEKCHAVTKALKDCMEAHPDHYEPILRAEKAAEQELEKELEKEKEKEREGVVVANSETKEEAKEVGSVEESVETVGVEGGVESESEADSEQKLAV